MEKDRTDRMLNYAYIAAVYVKKLSRRLSYVFCVIRI